MTDPRAHEPLSPARTLAPVREWWTWGRAALLVLIVGAALLTRLVGLGDKPIMHDESLFVYYSNETIRHQLIYEYQPILHGPLHLWYQAGIFHLFGDSDYTMRLGIAILGLLGLVWVWMLRPWLGNIGVFVAMAFYVVSPSLMVYQRFFREDGVFLFLTMGMVATGAWWWRTRRAGWGAAFLAHLILLFLNKESCLFLYFGIATFGLLVLVHDIASGLASRGFPDLRLTEFPWGKALTLGIVLFVVPVFLFVMVIEGIAYDYDVIEAGVRDFPLRDLRTLPMLFGWMEPDPSLGALGQPTFWRLALPLMLAVGLMLSFLWFYLVRTGIGKLQMARTLHELLVRHGVALTVTFLLGWAAYLFLFTTAYEYPKGPFQLYHETLAYWMGQNAQHRIKGPFHMHLMNMAIYELPALLALIATCVGGLFARDHGRRIVVALALCIVPLLGLHVAVFMGAGPVGMPWMILMSVVLMAGIAAVLIFPRWQCVWLPLVALQGIVFSLLFFLSRRWRTFLETPFTTGADHPAGPTVWSGGLHYIDEKLSLTSGFHLFLIAAIIFLATVKSWRHLDRGEYFPAFAIWWFATMAGAVSYAREKVPWVGIHLALPLVLLAGVLAEGWWHRVRARRGNAGVSIFLGVLALALLWQTRTAINAAFVNAGDVRERLYYAETTRDVQAHARLITETARDRHVRVWVGHEDVVWPLRWYLRDVDWVEGALVETALLEDYDFLFLTAEHVYHPDLVTNYEITQARARMHWTPNTVPWNDWTTIWRYLWSREIPDTSDRALPAPVYYFAQRKPAALDQD